MNSIKFGKTYYPSEKEFMNFNKYVSNLIVKEKADQLYGTIKVNLLDYTTKEI